MKKLRIYSFTKVGSSLNRRVLKVFRELSYPCEGYTVGRFADERGLKELPEKWKEEIGERWGKEAFLFIGAAGIAVRAIAPFVKDKFTDSPVIVMDEQGGFVIPLLSGHVGGAVELSRLIAEAIGSRAVITTATDVNETFAVDVFAVRNHLIITEREKAKRISAAILEGKRVGIFSEFPILDQVPEALVHCVTSEELKSTDMGIMICRTLPKSYEEQENILYLPAKNLYVGLGCRRGVGSRLLREQLKKVLDLNGFQEGQIRAIGSIDLKKDEEGLLKLAEDLRVSFDTFSAGELKKMGETTNASAFVEQITGVDNVCERAGRKLCPDGVLVQEKICMEKCTAAIVEGKVKIRFQS